MKKTAEITPLPWTEDRFGSLTGSNGEHIIVWGLGIGWGSRNDTTEANAAYIVRACNNFPKLVEALKKAEDEFSEIISYAIVEKNPIIRPAEQKSISHVREIVRKAIASAEGE